jgi:hypothetical protein
VHIQRSITVSITNNIDASHIPVHHTHQPLSGTFPILFIVHCSGLDH